jgi:hypothetical protein
MDWGGFYQFKPATRTTSLEELGRMDHGTMRQCLRKWARRSNRKNPYEIDPAATKAANIASWEDFLNEPPSSVPPTSTTPNDGNPFKLPPQPTHPPLNTENQTKEEALSGPTAPQKTAAERRIETLKQSIADKPAKPVYVKPAIDTDLQKTQRNAAMELSRKLKAQIQMQQQQVAKAKSSPPAPKKAKKQAEVSESMFEGEPVEQQTTAQSREMEMIEDVPERTRTEGHSEEQVDPQLEEERQYWQAKIEEEKRQQGTASKLRTFVGKWF